MARWQSVRGPTVLQTIVSATPAFINQLALRDTYGGGPVLVLGNLQARAASGGGINWQFFLHVDRVSQLNPGAFFFRPPAVGSYTCCPIWILPSLTGFHTLEVLGATNAFDITFDALGAWLCAIELPLWEPTTDLVQ